MKKTALAAALMLATGASQAATYDILGGTFFMEFVTPAPVVLTPGTPGVISDGDNDIGGPETGAGEGSLFFNTFDFFLPGAAVSMYLSSTSGGGPNAAVSIDTAGSSDLSAWTAFWNGTEFNQGGAASSTDNGDGSFKLSWSSFIVGGPFDGFTGSWTMDVKEQAGVVPVPAAVWLFGSGLLGLIGIARRRKS